MHFWRKSCRISLRSSLSSRRRTQFEPHWVPTRPDLKSTWMSSLPYELEKKWHLISILVPWLAEAESSAIHCQLLGFERWDRGWGLFHPISIYIPIKDVHMFQHILWAIIHGGYVDIFLMHSAHAGEKLPPCEGPSQGHSDWAEEAKRFVNLGTTHGFALFGFWCHLAPRGKCLRTLLGNPGWYIYLYLVNI